MADCKSCKDKKNAADVDGQYAADIIAAYAERNAKRLWVALILTILLLVASNGLWIWRESQYADVVTTQTVEQETDGNGDNTFVGGDMYGSAESDNDNENANP